MTASVPVAVPMAVIGAGPHATALLRHAAPLAEVQILRCAPAPDAADRSAAIDLARHFGAAFSPEWHAVLGDPNVPAVLALGGLAGRAAVVGAALQMGKVVLCPFPAAPDDASLAALEAAQRQGGGILLTLSEIAGTAAGGHALQVLQEGRLGKLHSIWAAAREPRDAAAEASVLDQQGWPILDFLLAAVREPVTRLHAELATLFGRGAHHDTAVILIRFQQDVVATIELSRCLPASIPGGEVEIEAIGARQVVRVEPHRSAVRVYGEAGVRTRPWTDGPLIRALPDVIAAVRTGKADAQCLERTGRAIGVMDAIGRAATAKPISPR